MLPVKSGGHSAYQTFILYHLSKYYPNPNSIDCSTWDINDRFWSLDLSFTDEFMRIKYSVYGLKPRTSSCMQRSYLLSIAIRLVTVISGNLGIVQELLPA